MSRYANKITAGTIGTVVRDDGALLLLQRQKEPFVGKWCMPGGKIEFGEHPSAAMIREFREETGLIADIERFCGVASEIVPAGNEQSHFLLYVFRLRIVNGSVLHGGTEEGPLEWFSPSNLSGHTIPSDQWMIEHMLLREDGPKLVELASTDTASSIVRTH
ncbi:NUDIX hydrolase [Alicyclobacillus pomorum]|jgi:8-oxo-dGTP diphosphatase|uniref:NUDIX hydrolase n=1 Tax=Alicyclobacillus pomorum TaxID=204470 RepID=UPI0003F6EE1A|nr:NUDIX domain-containing protein [Alicyclobacillus pomorum]